MSEIRFPRLLRLLPFVAALLPTHAGALPRALEIDPAQSRIRVLPTSGVWLDLIEPIGPLFFPFSAQAGGDSTATDLTGWLRIEETLDFSLPQFIIQSGTIEPVASGSWQPGLPATPNVAAPAAVAVAWSGVWLDGEAALRDLAFSGSANDTVDVVVAGERWRWPTAPFDGPLAPRFEFRVSGGVVDLDVPLIPDLRFGLYETILVSLRLSDAKRADIRRFDGKHQLVLPIDVSTELGPNDFETGLPLRLQLDLAGRIVAKEIGYAPEPGVALQLAAACIALAAIARRRS